MHRAILPIVAILLVSAQPLRADEDAAKRTATQTWVREILQRLETADAAPEFPEGREWLNVARPLTLAKDLRGKVVLLDFWCYCCINCIHVLPDLEYLEKKYKDKPFAVIGVHSAKFDNEKHIERIREAVRRYEIKHPVVNDADFKIWRDYGARSWPTFALVTPDAKILGLLSGEGRREELDALVEALLERYAKQEDVKLNVAPLPIQLESSKRRPGSLAYPGNLAVDAVRNSLFVADSNHNRVLELRLDGTFKRAWGDGARGLVDGRPTRSLVKGATARFFRPQGLAVRGDTLWVADTENHALRAIDLKTGAVRTIAGDGSQGRARTGSYPAKQATLNSPWALHWVADQLIIAMAGAHQLWRYDPARDVIEHHAGDGSERRLDATSLEAAAFAQPSGLAHDGTSLYVADSESSSIVEVGPKGVVTLAGANDKPRDLFHFGDEDGQGRGRRFQHCLGVAVVGDRLFVADSYNHKIKTVSLAGPARGTVSSFLGDGTPGLQDDPARFSEPGGLAANGTTLYVADTNNHAIRVIDTATKQVRTLALQGVPIPQTHARASRTLSSDWPQLSDTVTGPSIKATIQAHGRTPLTVKLSLPDGWKLTEGAPSQMRIEVGKHVQDLPIQGVSTEAALPSLLPGTHQGALRLLYYVCEDAGTCRIRSVTYVLKIDARESAEGNQHIVQLDAFVP